jgi:hypothetical protein
MTTSFMLLGLIVVSGPAVLALEAAAGKPSLSLVSKAGSFGKGQDVDAAGSSDEPIIKTEIHDKVKGNGYAPGSPLYDKQEGLKSGGGGGGGQLSDEEAKNMPVSTTLQCICNLCLQFFSIYTALMVVRGMNLLQKSREQSPIERIIVAATDTVAQAPMLCVLFLGTRMRAIQISAGQTEKYGLPQWWVQGAMQVCSWAVLVQLIMVFVIPVATGQMPGKADETVYTQNRSLRVILDAIRFSVMLGLFGGAVVIVVGIHQMEVPKEIHPSGEVPVSPAVQCTIALASLYFLTFFCFEIFKTYNYFQGLQTTRGYETFKLATYTVAFCPMLCVLFIGARMRALSMGLDGPQSWAQGCFYACTISVWIVTSLVILVPLLFGIRPKEGQFEGDISFESSASENQLMAAKILAVVRWIAMVALYLGFTAVMVSTQTLEHPKGPEHTPPLAPAMLCVTIFTVQYFAIYLAIWIVVTLKQFTARGDSSRGQDTLLQALFAAKDSVMAAPMLSVLFLGARMRALQITNNKGAPQGWAQDCMFTCVVSVILQAICAIVVSFMAPRDKPGAMGSDDGNKTAAGVAAFQFLLMLVMHGCGLAVIISVFMITPETANGRGSVLMDNVADTTPDKASF